MLFYLNQNFRRTWPFLLLAGGFCLPAAAQADYSLQASIYDSTGETVRILATASSVPQPILNIQITGGPLSSVSKPATITADTGLQMTWDGRNSTGGLVSNGVYYVQVLSTDSYGAATQVTQTVNVTWAGASVSLKIYNEAGELIKTLFGTVADNANLSLQANLSDDILSLSPGNSSNTINITLSDGTQLTWDGRNDAGEYVTAGKYQLEVHTLDGANGEATVIRQVTVMGVPASLKIRALPALADPTVTQVVFDDNGAGGSMKVRLYSLNGELIGPPLVGTAGTGQVVWDLAAGAPASGLYLARVETLDGTGRSDTQVVKVAVKR